MKRFQILLAVLVSTALALAVTGSPCDQLKAKLGDQSLPVTECAFSNGTAGCCAIRDGVCCQDAPFCCPKDFSCDAKQMRCVKDALYIPFHVRIEKLDAAEATVGKEILCPDNVTSCKETQTCCIFDGNQYGCCPLAGAVCCDDKKHCCPKNYNCNPSQGKCDRKDTGESIAWLEKLPGIKRENSVVCPGGAAQCPDGSTCCQLSSGDWGCCPLPNATCCSDHLHCCPNGYTCDTTSGRCNKGDISLPFYNKIKAATKVPEKKEESVVCPGGAAQCPDGSTCCQLSSGDYGCCPLPNATCCNDHLHCCPNGYKCDTTSGRCNKGDISIPFYRKEQATKIEKPTVESVVCPGGAAQCPDGSTCCQLSSGDYGCCPLPNATCCNDHLHCCPNGYKCDTTSGRCNKGDISIPFYRKEEATKVEKPTVESVVCPGGAAQCPDGSTCCQLSSGDYGCCPLPNATCCNDHLHCCPNGYTCDTTSGRCNKGDISLPFYQKIKATKVPEKKEESVVCPGGAAQCPDGSTCCQLSSGDYGCCPLPNATCCNDHLHCCPNGYTCDTTSGRCNKGMISVPFFKKQEATPIESTSVVCPGGAAQCPDGSTCCQLSSGDYGCCPLPNATCCSDHLHCCPNGYTCDTTSGRCNKGDISIPFYHKLKASQVVKKVESVVCPGGAAQCPDGSTCCQLSSGDYGCCPLPNATCCNDHLHCCPNGYKCDTTSGRCNKGDISIPFYNKIEATKIEKPAVESVVCPGGAAQCPDGSTCCQLSSGDYGCCPLPNATCCNDHLHCCPNGYKCDTTSGRCNKGDISIPFYRKEEATKIGKPAVESVVCPGGAAQCPDGSTCCQLSSGDYGCCPLPNATCCSDHLHCCPNGYTCDTTSGRCNKGEISLPFYHKIKATPVAPKPHVQTAQDTQALNKNFNNLTSVVCPDGSSFCPEDYTCCKMSDGSYGCCPLPSAVCCSDHLHCCPTGTKCNMQKQCCDPSGPSGESVAWRAKVPGDKMFIEDEETSKLNNAPKVAQNPVICRDNSTCDPLKVCCKMQNGGYGCCPYSDGVCCEQTSSCCPGGTVCGPVAGDCRPKQVNYHVQFNWHTIELQAGSIKPSKMVQSLNAGSLVCPGGETQCDAEATCCKRSDGSFACCPYNNGTCCGPEGYCCPSGFTCDAQNESCTYNDPDANKPPIKPSEESSESKPKNSKVYHGRHEN